MAHITIVTDDNAVYKNQGCYLNLDLSACGIPENVHALQWDGVNGEIEYRGDVPNEAITSLPDWVASALVKWDEAAAAEELASQQPAITEQDKIDAANRGKDYVDEDFWDQYPEANLDSVNKLLNTKIDGITLGKAHKNLLKSGKLYGVSVQSVTYGSLGLTGLQTVYDLSKKYGVASFSDRMYMPTQGLLDYLTQTGWNIYTGTDHEGDYWIAYVTWEGELISNKAKEDINSARNETINQGYNDGTHVWDIDAQSMTNMTSRASVVQDTDSVVWRTKDNNNITMTGAEFKTLFAGCVAAVDAIYQGAWTQKDNV